MKNKNQRHNKQHGHVKSKNKLSKQKNDKVVKLDKTAGLKSSLGVPNLNTLRRH